MGSTGGGFIIGFFLAILISSSLIYIILAPYSNEITLAYDTTQSPWFDTAVNLLNSIKGVADHPIAKFLSAGISGDAGKIIGGITGFMVQAKQTMFILYNIMIFALPGMVISVIMVIIGVAVVARSKSVKVIEKIIKHCTKCGTEVKAEDRFCPSCGKKV